MTETKRIQRAGIAGMIGAIVWIVSLLIEYRYHLAPPGSGRLFLADQIGFLLAEIGIVWMLSGLLRSRAAGDTRFGRIASWIFLGGWIALLAELALSIPLIAMGRGVGALDFLLPIGGIASLVGAVLTGIAIVRARRWTGWPRYAVLAYAAYDLLVIFVPLIVLNSDGPTELTEGLWMVMFFIVGAALLSASRAEAEASPIVELAPGAA